MLKRRVCPAPAPALRVHPIVIALACAACSNTRKGTLLGVLDACVTPFGKRRLRQWLCAPLLRPVDIDAR